MLFSAEVFSILTNVYIFTCSITITKKKVIVRVKDPNDEPTFTLPTGQETNLRTGFNSILGRWTIEKGDENPLCLYEEVYFGQGMHCFPDIKSNLDFILVCLQCKTIAVFKKSPQNQSS